jgi:hypothetical protein
MDSTDRSAGANSRMMSVLKGQGFDVSQVDAERAATVLSGIERDLARLDEASNSDCSATPRFEVGEGNNDVG